MLVECMLWTGVQCLLFLINVWFKLFINCPFTLALEVQLDCRLEGGKKAATANGCAEIEKNIFFKNVSTCVCQIILCVPYML